MPAHKRGDDRVRPEPWSEAAQEAQRLGSDLDALRRNAELTADERLQQLEEDLDQCWDLLRQRRAKRQYGENPDEAEARPITQVEGYNG